MLKKFTSGFRFFLCKFLFPACCFFTLFVVFLYLLPSTEYLRKDKLFVLLFAAVGTAAIDLVLFIPKISVYFKVATHFIGLMVLLLGVLWFSDYMKTGNWVLIMVSFALIYAIVCPVVLIVRAQSQKKKREEPKEEYQSKFKK